MRQAVRSISTTLTPRSSSTHGSHLLHPASFSSTKWPPLRPSRVRVSVSAQRSPGSPPTTATPRSAPSSHSRQRPSSPRAKSSPSRRSRSTTHFTEPSSTSMPSVPISSAHRPSPSPARRRNSGSKPLPPPSRSSPMTVPQPSSSSRETSSPSSTLGRCRSTPTAQIPDWIGSTGARKLRVSDTNGRTGMLKAPLSAFSLVSSTKDDPDIQEFALVSSVLAVSKPYPHTQILLKDPLINCYDRTMTTVNANVGLATAGRSVSEIMGNGSAATPNQTFVLRQKPLTYIQSPTPTGRLSTLQVRANGVAWKEVPTLYQQKPSATRLLHAQSVRRHHQSPLRRRRRQHRRRRHPAHRSKQCSSHLSRRIRSSNQRRRRHHHHARRPPARRQRRHQS